MAPNLEYTIRFRRDGYWPDDEEDPRSGFETYVCTVLGFRDVRLSSDEVFRAVLLGMGGAEFAASLDQPDFVAWRLDRRFALPEEPETTSAALCVCSTTNLADVDFDADPIVLPERVPGGRAMLDKVEVADIPERE